MLRITEAIKLISPVIKFVWLEKTVTDNTDHKKTEIEKLKREKDTSRQSSFTSFIFYSKDTFNLRACYAL